MGVFRDTSKRKPAVADVQICACCGKEITTDRGQWLIVLMDGKSVVVCRRCRNTKGYKLPAAERRRKLLAETSRRGTADAPLSPRAPWAERFRAWVRRLVDERIRELLKGGK